MGDWDESKHPRDKIGEFTGTASGDKGSTVSNKNTLGRAGGGSALVGGRDAKTVLYEQEKAAKADFQQRYAAGERFGVSKLPVDGGTLITGVDPRKSNSRGANRSGHLATTFRLHPSDQKYSKKISRESALKLLK